MQAGAAQYLGDLDLAQRWAKSLEPLHGVTDEVRKLVDRLADLHERISTMINKSFHPGGYGGRCHKNVSAVCCKDQA